jgi:hypothetical protein
MSAILELYAYLDEDLDLLHTEICGAIAKAGTFQGLRNLLGLSPVCHNAVAVSVVLEALERRLQELDAGRHLRVVRAGTCADWVPTYYHHVCAAHGIQDHQAAANFEGYRRTWPLYALAAPYLQENDNRKSGRLMTAQVS